jgi:hypothetical protein
MPLTVNGALRIPQRFSEANAHVVIKINSANDNNFKQ